MSGFYLIRVPAGVYNLSVHAPVLTLYANNVTNVTVTDGSSATVNFQLQQQSSVAVPEFQTDVTGLVMVVVFAATLLIMKKAAKRVNAR
jgi:hypothetical protein